MCISQTVYADSTCVAGYRCTIASHHCLRCSIVNACFSSLLALDHLLLNALKSDGVGLPGLPIASATAGDMLGVGALVPAATLAGSKDSIESYAALCKEAREVEAMALGEKEGRWTPVSGSIWRVRRLGSLVLIYGLSWRDQYIARRED